MDSYKQLFMYLVHAEIGALVYSSLSIGSWHVLHNLYILFCTLSYTYYIYIVSTYFIYIF